VDAILDEDFFKLGDLPVMVCALRFGSDSWTLGYSVSRRVMYDDGFARACAKKNAMATRLKYEEKRDRAYASRVVARAGS
jgi:hypothetical protein